MFAVKLRSLINVVSVMMPRYCIIILGVMCVISPPLDFARVDSSVFVPKRSSCAAQRYALRQVPLSAV